MRMVIEKELAVCVLEQKQKKRYVNLIQPRSSSFTISAVSVLKKKTLPFVCKVLLVSSNNHPGNWIVPAGGVEPGEVPEEAAIREVAEEVSFTFQKHHARG